MLPYFESEAGTVVELLGVVATLMKDTGASAGTCPQVSGGAAQEVIELVTPWKARPVNFAFLVAALQKLGVWEQVHAVKSITGTTLGDTNAAVTAQATETGALADIGDLDTASLNELLDGMTQDVGSTAAYVGKQYVGKLIPGKTLVDWVLPLDSKDPGDAVALELVNRVFGAAPDARGELVKQIVRAGKLERLCEHLPWTAVQALHDAIDPFDPQTADLLAPYFEGKGGGRSMDRMYRDHIDEDRREDHEIRADAWWLLEHAHDLVSGGFMSGYSAAYDAREGGLNTEDSFRSSVTNAVSKAAVVWVASKFVGTAAGRFANGAALAVGAGKSGAALIEGGVGGFAGNLGGHFAGDVYDHAANGKRGFDSFGSYMTGAAFGGLVGTTMAGLSVAAGKYLGGGGAPPRPVDMLAARYPQSIDIFERFNAAAFEAGQGAGSRVGAGLVRFKVTVSELTELLSSGAAVRGPQFALAEGLPPDTELEVGVRPLEMSSSEFNGQAPTPLQVAEAVQQPRLVRPSRQSSETSKPRGKPTLINPNDVAPENIAAIESENQSAAVLARHGYDVEQNPNMTDTLKNPDYKIEGEIFDNVAPTTANVRAIWSRVEEKVVDEQTRRVVVNVDRSNVDLDLLRRQFSDWPIDGLEQVLVIKGEVVMEFWP